MAVRTFPGLFIGGEWVQPLTYTDTHVVLDSVTEEPLESMPRGSKEDVERAVAAARRALPGWSATPVNERAEAIRALAAALRSRVDDIAPLISREVGMPIGGASGYQTLRAADLLESFADFVLQIPLEERVGGSLVSREAVGVVGAITPSNFPLLLTLVKLGPALAAGCTVLLKPSEATPGSLFILAEEAHRVGLPAGVLNLVTGVGPEVGETLALHPDVDMISFTGSTTVGKHLYQLAAGGIKRVHLELGGKSAAVILDDAPLEESIANVVDQAMINAGQICFAWSRLLVPAAKRAAAEEALREKLSSFVVGDPLDPRTTMGPIVTAAAQERVRGYIDGAIADGGTLVCGGSRMPAGIDRGYFIQPTVISGVDPSSRIAQEEVFGPVVTLLEYSDDEDAVEVANNSRFGLHGAVFSSDEERALWVARRMRTGQVDINGFKLDKYAPFGGFKESGIGRELGMHGLDEYLELKAIQA